jgi:uncharacterized cupin superfamily protein
LIAHWDDVESDGDLAQAAGAVAVSLRRFDLAPGEQRELPLRRTEDVLFVVAGSGDGLRTHDCVVYGMPHDSATLRAGDDGLSVLLFATPVEPPPFHSGASATPRTINVADADSAYEGEAGRWVQLARQAGVQHAGVNYGRLEPGNDGAPPHCHSADEELFVVLGGSGTLELGVGQDGEVTRHELRRGHVVSRTPGSGVAHSFRAGDEGLRYLAYGPHDPNDIAYFPRSKKVYIRGVELIARIETLGYWVDEE